MNPLHYAGAALAWLGRQGTRAVALPFLIAIPLAPFLPSAKPYLPETIFLLLVLSFLRVRPQALRGHLTRPLVFATSVWIMLLLPAVLGFAFIAAGLPDLAPGIFLGLMLQAMAPPIMVTPALAALIGLDVALVLATLIVCVVATPLTAAGFAAVFVGTGFAISAPDLGGKLFLLLAGSAFAAALIRRCAGQLWLDAQHETFDGINIVILFVFALAAMDGVLPALLADPVGTLGLAAAAFALTLAMLALTVLVFIRAGRLQALAIAISASNRNMGLMLAAVSGTLPESTWLYFGLAQFPIYLMPEVLKRLARRMDAGQT